MSAPTLKPGWSGKIAAQVAGVTRAAGEMPQAKWFLLTDADIAHGAGMLKRLVAKAESEDRHLVSLMVLLKAGGFAAKLLIPAFVFFFQKLYPFAWVNNPHLSMAAAAGGTMLVRRKTLEHVGGLESIRHELIDDCALARRIKHAADGSLRPIWLGLSAESVSLRPYPALADVWRMVARAAFTELDRKSVV